MPQAPAAYAVKQVIQESFVNQNRSLFQLTDGIFPHNLQPNIETMRGKSEMFVSEAGPDAAAERTAAAPTSGRCPDGRAERDRGDEVMDRMRRRRRVDSLIGWSLLVSVALNLIFAAILFVR